MNIPKIRALRLYNTGLRHSPFKNAPEAVSHLGAVQAQDFTAAKWSLGLRINNSTDKDIEKEFNAGTILRTHVLRPTWHFVTPENIRWMLELTAPRVKAVQERSDRELELDAGLLARSNAAITRALQDHTYLTRQELKKVLADIGIRTDVRRLAHILMWAELDSLICSGPLRGKQFTYALLSERVRKTPVLSREEALAKLAFTYFTGHGPAQLADFSWWSGLSGQDAKIALDLVRSRLDSETLDGKIYWFTTPDDETVPEPPPALLLPIYDEYTIAYKDKSLVSETRDLERMIARGAAFTAVIILNGKVAGNWSKALKKNSVEIKLNPSHELTPDEQTALESQVACYGKFFAIPAILIK